MDKREYEGHGRSEPFSRPGSNAALLPIMAAVFVSFLVIGEENLHEAFCRMARCTRTCRLIGPRRGSTHDGGPTIDFERADVQESAQEFPSRSARNICLISTISRYNVRHALGVFPESSRSKAVRAPYSEGRNRGHVLAHQRSLGLWAPDSHPDRDDAPDHRSGRMASGATGS